MGFEIVFYSVLEVITNYQTLKTTDLDTLT